MIVLLTVAALLIIAGAAWAAGMFPDVDPSNTHAGAIQWAADNGIVNGYANGNFGPDDPILRGQAATMFKNYDDFAKSSSTGGTTGCKDCHNDTTLLTGKEASYGVSVHGAGVKGEEVTVGDVTFATPGESAFELALSEGTRKDCAGCHSGNGFSDRVAAGLDPPEVTAGQTDPTRVDCRACHQIHTTFTGVDWALETTAPVAYYAAPGLVGKTFDGGAGNLCAACHQPRVDFPAAVDGMVTVSSTRFGPHHGPQSAMLQGVAGAGAPDQAGMHYTLVADTCVTCHMGANANHLFEPSLANCSTCHGDDTAAIQAKVDGLQAEVQALGDTLKEKLVAANMLNATSGAAVAGTYTEAKAAALWDYRTVMIEDKSVGVHNPTYAKALLNAGIAAFN